ncbi:MAG: copper resistance protein CopC [Oligoflexia bacterium]|nr:copper resistance protein CopC [Oligoflexia bacterium]
MKKFSKALLFFCAVLIFNSLPAFAHVFLKHADPKVGSDITAAPTEVKIWFTDEFDPSGTTVQVFNSGGKEIDLKDDRQDKADPTLLIVSVPELAPGTYLVRWQGLCLEGHHTEGSYKFTIEGAK